MRDNFYYLSHITTYLFCSFMCIYINKYIHIYVYAYILLKLLQAVSFRLAV
jgi:hypothetical protein